MIGIFFWPNRSQTVLQMDEVLQLERHVMHFRGRAADEIHGVMIRIAAHEHEEVGNPIRDPEAHHLAVKLGGLCRILDDPGDVAELERPDAVVLQMLAEIAPFLEQRDRRALVILKREHRPDARNRIVAQLAFDAVLFQVAGKRAEIGLRRHFERQRGAAFDVALVDLDGELADLGGEEGAVFFLLGEHQPHHLGVIVDKARQVGCLEGGVSDASWLDHGGSRSWSSAQADDPVIAARWQRGSSRGYWIPRLRGV